MNTKNKITKQITQYLEILLEKNVGFFENACYRLVSNEHAVTVLCLLPKYLKLRTFKESTGKNTCDKMLAETLEHIKVSATNINKDIYRTPTKKDMSIIMFNNIISSIIKDKDELFNFLSSVSKNKVMQALVSDLREGLSLLDDSTIYELLCNTYLEIASNSDKEFKKLLEKNYQLFKDELMYDDEETCNEYIGYVFSRVLSNHKHKDYLVIYVRMLLASKNNLQKCHIYYMLLDEFFRIDPNLAMFKATT